MEPPLGGPAIRPLESIRAKITLGIVALLIFMTLVTTAVTMERSEDALSSQITLTHEARATIAAQEVDQALERVKTIARSAATSSEMQRAIGPEDFENGTVPEDRLSVKRLLLEHAYTSDDMFEGAAIVDIDGRILMGEPYTLQQQILEDTQRPLQADYYQRLAEFTTEVPTPVVHAGGARESWTVSMRLTTDTGEIWGVMILHATTASLGQIIGTTQDDDTFFMILDRSGTVLIGPPGIPPGTDLSAPVDELQSQSHSSKIFTHEGTDYLFTLASLGDDWRLAVAQDSDVAFAPVDAMLFTILSVAGLVIVIGVVTGLFFAGRITAPVVRLKQAAQRVAAGEYGTQVRATTKDELADLAQTFNTMSAQLLEEHERLRRHQQSLEATVEERTRELAEKNEELEAFVYAASHDLRTPIITLDWLLEELDGALATQDEGAIKDTLQRLRANVTGMDELVEHLLELSRIGRTEGEPVAVMLRPVIDHAVEQLDRRREERNVSIHIHFDDTVMVQADPRRMEQVFGNLLSNAIKYGREGGNIHIRATAIGDERRPWKWRLEIADDGPGIEPGLREEVFQLFRRGPQDPDAAAEGTGIGLAIVRKIIRAYGGEIKATRADEGGALFWFTLNATRPGASTARPEAVARDWDQPGESDEPPAPAPHPAPREAQTPR